ncbi:hypothetical protein R6Q57_020397 [Mikania cordata]
MLGNVKEQPFITLSQNTFIEVMPIDMTIVFVHIQIERFRISTFIVLIMDNNSFFGAALAYAQKDIKRGLAYSTMSQLGYTMVALGIGSYRNALFHLITHAYSKALLFLGSGSVIQSMDTLFGYCPKKSQTMVLMGGTLSLCGIPPLACFLSKDEILNDSWLYSPIFAIIAWSKEGLTEPSQKRAEPSQLGYKRAESEPRFQARFTIRDESSQARFKSEPSLS